MANSADSDLLASSEANWSGSTLFAKMVYPSSAGKGLIWLLSIYNIITCHIKKVLYNFYHSLSLVSRLHFEIFSIFSQKKRFWHFMHIVSYGDCMKCPSLFSEKKKKKFRGVIYWNFDPVYWALILCTLNWNTSLGYMLQDAPSSSNHLTVVTISYDNKYKTFWVTC